MWREGTKEQGYLQKEVSLRFYRVFQDEALGREDRMVHPHDMMLGYWERSLVQWDQGKILWCKDDPVVFRRIWVFLDH